MKQKTSPKRCADCGFKKRGISHSEGVHHKNGKDGKYKIKRI